MAEGLEAAHEKGVIHRDHKPGNVKVTPEGKVKVLDFGLAKAFADPHASASQSESPPVTRPPSESGVILGTAAYMSPEQARGKSLDKRTDVWSFGCSLFEALSRRAAFLGETVSDTLAKILEREPDWEALPSRTPRRIRELLAGCLTKDPVMRLHDIADARIEIAKAFEEPAETASPVGARVNRTALAAIGLAGIFAAVALWSLTRAPETTERTVTRSILPLRGGEFLYGEAPPSLAISPDGRYVAYVASRDSPYSPYLYLRRLDALEPRAIEGSEGPPLPSSRPTANGWDSRRAGYSIALA